MEVQLQELIDKIKSEGIAKAEKTGKQIRQKAEENAAALIADARKKAEAIVDAAKEKARKFEITGKKAVGQAGRDLLLKLKSDIVNVLDAVIKQEVKGTLTGDVLKEIITRLITAWADKGDADITILLSKSDRKMLEDHFHKKLSKKMKEGITFSSGQGVDAGFRIVEKDGSAFYDLTDKGIAEVLSQYLSPQLKECIENALKDGSKA
jgi:V/A-type H+-transporting ATPase subunit E